MTFVSRAKTLFPIGPAYLFFSSTRPITNLAASCNLLLTRALDHDRKGYKFQQDIEDTFMTCWIFWGEGNVICLAFFFFRFPILLLFCPWARLTQSVVTICNFRSPRDKKRKSSRWDMAYTAINFFFGCIGTPQRAWPCLHTYTRKRKRQRVAPFDKYRRNSRFIRGQSNHSY